ncbi:MAG: ATP-grasp domain-containing protein, partial [Candidatus Hydrogenedentes bacterium]|nr:ATP-grasp domain-containing protein [Candidatus Hydrogenedentota bacterium]
MSRNILIAGFPRRELLRAARETGLHAYVMHDGTDWGSPDEAYELVEGHISDVEDVLSAAAVCDPVGVIAASEEAVVAVAKAANEIGLPGVSPWAATRTRNKVALRQALSAKGLPNPAYREAVDPDEAERAARELGLPVIVKPVDGYAGLGVSRVDHTEDMALAFPLAQRHSAQGVVIIEAYLDGPEFSVEGIKVDGEFHVFAIAGRERMDSAHPCTKAVFMPADVTTSTQGSLVAMARASLTAIGMMTGPAHVEFIMTDTGPYVIEIGAYTGAARIESSLVALATGVDTLHSSVRVAIGESLPRFEPENKGAAACWIDARPGIVTEIEGIDDARQAPGVECVHVGVQPGDSISHVRDCRARDRIGHVLATGASAAEALERAKRASGICRIATQPTR